jgi:hypothetical protein
VVPRDQVVALAAQLRNMPDAVRRFDTGPAAALRTFGLGGELLDLLRGCGVPHVDTVDGPLFDRTDLLNAAMQLDTGSRQRRVLTWWVRELERPYPAAVSYRLDYVAGCPDTVHDGSCTYSLLHPAGRRAYRLRRGDRTEPLASATFTLPRTWPPLPAEARELLDGVADVRFMRLPDALRWDVAFMLSRRLADCCGVAAYLTAEAHRRRLRARMSYGRALTPPFSSTHYWAEFLVDRCWVPVDPVFIGALLEWDLLSPVRWRRESSIGAILGRLSGTWQPTALHNGQPVTVELPVSRIVSRPATNR